MDMSSRAGTHAYAVQVDFFTGEHRYASDIWTVEAGNKQDAEQLALAAAQASAYVDPRIPQCWGHACARPLLRGGHA